MNPNGNPDPEIYPSVVIDGTKYNLAMSLEDAFNMEEDRHVSLFDAPMQKLTGKDAIKRALEILSYALHLQGVEITSQELAKKLPFKELRSVVDAVGALVSEKKIEAVQPSPPPAVVQ